MTARSGGVISQSNGGGAALGGKKGRNAGGLASTSAASTWKNTGYYAAGAVWESWISAGAASTTPPSGHTLTFVRSIKLSG